MNNENLRLWISLGSSVVLTAAPLASVSAAALHAADHAKTPLVLAAGGEGGEAGHKMAGGEGGEVGGDGKAADTFAGMLDEIRGHLLIGDELVKTGEWKAAFIHFLHPAEEIYEGLAPELGAFGVAPFKAELDVLADLVKAEQGGTAYTSARGTVLAALKGADEAVAKHEPDLAYFQLERALFLLETAGQEYEEAISDGKVVNVAEYQDARGFVWLATEYIDAAASDLAKRDAEAVTRLRDGLAELKEAWPTAMPPALAARDLAFVLSGISRIQLTAAKFM